MLFEKIGIIDENFEYIPDMYVGIKGDSIAYVGREKPAEDFGESYDGTKKVLLPGFVNAHTHSPMSLLRGYAENLPLDRWLNEKVFPFEDRLNDERAYYGTLLSIAEMLSSGTTSYSDMYFFTDGVMRAAKEAKARTNYSRCITSFTDDPFFENERVKESIYAIDNFHKSENGRIRIDLSLHAEYTNTLKTIEAFGDWAKTKDLVCHIHVSETQSEHEACKVKYGKTPVKLFDDAGVFGSKSLLAHCVWIEDSDIEILKDKGVSVAHNPVSNLKLGSGVCDTYKLLTKGVNVAIGTDSSSSNNGLDMMREMFIAAILPKGIQNKADIVSPKDVLKMATVNGAVAQGRTDTGLIKEGYKADITVIDMDKPALCPDYNVINNIVYSAEKSDVILTMTDGNVLYRDGEFTSIDIEKVKYECNRIVREVVSEVNA